MKVVIIGASHGGITVAKNIKELDHTVEVHLIDEQKQEELGYISNGINLYLNQMIDQLSQATTSVKELNDLGVFFHFQTRVEQLNQSEKTVSMLNHLTNKKERLDYDYLVLAVGSSPLYQKEHQQTYCNLLNYKTIKESQYALPQLIKAKKIAILGAGYIGVELADALKKRGKDVYLLDVMSNVLPHYFDQDMMRYLEQKMAEKGISFYHDVRNVKFKEKKETQASRHMIETIWTKDFSLPVDLVVAPNLSIPNTQFLKDKIKLMLDDTVRVDDYLKTSDPSIYALGDIVPVMHYFKQTQTYLPLVNRTVRMARTIALNLTGHKQTYELWRKTSGTFVFDTFVGSTGLTEDEAPFYGYQHVKSMRATYPLDPSFYKKKRYVDAKIIYSPEDGNVLGIQMISDAFLAEQLNIAASVLQKKLTLSALSVYDFCFLPQYTPAFHFLNDLAFDALKQQSMNTKIK